MGPSSLPHSVTKKKRKKHRMECKNKESEGARNGRDNEDEYMQTSLFAAGTALTMACLKRVIMMFFVEQWRMWVFIVLNLVLLAIFFTSNRSTSSENQESGNNMEMENEKGKKEKRHCAWSTKLEASKECHHKLSKKAEDAPEVKQEDFGFHSISFPISLNSKSDSIALTKQPLEVDKETPKLSKEELKERVEAFIVMFRQHLVSDAREGRNKVHPRPKEREIFNAQKGSSLS